MNVLRKAFQTTYRQILKNLQHSEKIDEIVDEIQQELNIGDGDVEVNDSIKKYLVRVCELTLYCTISDPPFEIDI